MKIINRYSKPGHLADMEGFMEDQKAIAGDFATVGLDIKKAIDKTKRDLK